MFVFGDGLAGKRDHKGGVAATDCPSTHMPPLSHSVCMLQGFCPLCFKDRPGVTARERVDHQHPRIDKLQLLHCRRRNGLMPLDMERPGELCEDGQSCRVACLVCGKDVFTGGTDEYGLFRAHFEEGGAQEGEGHAAAMESVVRRNEMRTILRAAEAVETDVWHTPVHKRCAYAAPKCGCWLPLEAQECPTHRRMTPFTRCARPPARAAEPAPRPAPPAPRVEVCAPRPSPPSPPPCKLEPPAVARPSATGRGAVFVTELPVSTEQEAPPPAKPPQPKRRKAPPPPAPGPRLDGWVRREAARPDPAQRAFSVREHQRGFDPLVHGYVLKHNEMYYRYPDGRFLRVFSGVNTLTDDGQLLPDA